MEIDYHELRNLLRENVLKILFLKKDGTEREMYCTLMPETIKNTFSEKNKNEAVAQTRTIAVFDTEKQGWRSMIIENIISYSVIK